jgi:hypothetical protein
VFFVKITTIDNLDFVINLKRVTLLGRTSRIIDGITKDFTSVHYDMGEGTVTTFTVDCTLGQFHNFMEYFFSSSYTAIGPSLTEFLEQPESNLRYVDEDHPTPEKLQQLYSNQKKQSCNGNGKAQSTGE